MDQNNIINLLRLNNFTTVASDDLLGSIIDNVPVIIYVTDLEARAIVFINAKVNKIIGISEDEVYKKGFDFFTDYIHPDDYLKKMEQMSRLAELNQDEAIEIEARIETKGGNYQWYRIREKIFSRNKTGQPEKLISIAVNIHEQKLAEEESKKLTRELFKKNRELHALNHELESINRLASSEFRDLLQTIYTGLEYVAVRDAINFSNTGRANIRKTQGYIQKLRLAMHDLSAYLQLDKIRNTRQNIDLNKAVNEAINSLPQNQNRYSISSSSLPWIKGNYVLLTMLIKNLLENAVKFRKKEQVSSIRIHYLKADEINFHPLALTDTAYHIISFKDDGIGFEKHESERIFSIFYRIHGNKYHGAGMGLAVAKKIMELHGGFIEADSQPDEGSTFTCYFPEE